MIRKLKVTAKKCRDFWQELKHDAMVPHTLMEAVTFDDEIDFMLHFGGRFGTSYNELWLSEFFALLPARQREPARQAFAMLYGDAILKVRIPGEKSP